MDWEKTWIEEKRSEAEKEEGEGDLERAGSTVLGENRAAGGTNRARWAKDLCAPDLPAAAKISIALIGYRDEDSRNG